jgi:hypothetical protein
MATLKTVLSSGNSSCNKRRCGRVGPFQTIWRTKGNVQVAAYLSGPLAKAVREHARQLDRSQNWTLRDLIRSELRRRGVLPTPEQNGGNDPVQVEG